MPVYGLLKDNYIGAYMIRPSSLVSGNPIGKYGLKSHASHVFTNEYKRSCMRPYSACENPDPNVVIAAYGTQVTLHRCYSAKENCCSKETIPQQRTNKAFAPSFDVHIPTEHGLKRPMSVSPVSKKPDSLNAIIIRKDTEVNDVETGENTKKFSVLNIFEQSLSSVSSLQLKQTATQKLNAKATQNQFKNETNNSRKFYQSGGRCRTAWQKKQGQRNGTIPSIANLVDLCEVNYLLTNSLEKAQRNNEPERIIITPPNSETAESVELYRNSPETNTSRNSFDSEVIPKENFEKYYGNSILSMSKTSSAGRTNTTSPSVESKLDKTLHQSLSKSKIEEIWSNRHKKEIPTMRQFSHESLRRPKSAFATLPPREDYTNKQGTNLNEKDNQTKKYLGDIKRSRRNIRRRKKSSNYSDSPIAGVLYEHGRKNACEKTLQAPESCPSNLIDTKSLIRQNHRPTTAIRYCRQDRRTACSITPCVRKAEVSHSVYTTMHNHIPILSEKSTNYQAPSSRVTKSMSRDLSVKATRFGVIDQMPDSRPNDVQEQKLGENEPIHNETTGRHISDVVGNKQDQFTEIKRSQSINLRTSSGSTTNSNDVDSLKDQSHHIDNNDVITSRETKTRPNECAPLRLLLEQIPENCYNTGNAVPETNPFKKPLSGKVQPLLESSIYALENKSFDTDANSDVVKNKMIKKWLDEVITPIPSEEL